VPGAGCAAGAPGRPRPGQSRRAQRTDSTHVLGAIRELNRLELAGETLRAALEALASRTGWLRGDRPVLAAGVRARIDDLHLPESQARRQDLMVSTARTATTCWSRCTGRARRVAAGAARRAGAAADLDPAILPGGHRGRQEVRGGRSFLRGRLPPGRDRLISPYDSMPLQHQTGPRLGGYKVTSPRPAMPLERGPARAGHGPAPAAGPRRATGRT